MKYALDACADRTIAHDLPYETASLCHYDAFRRSVEALVDMPERTIDLLFRFLSHNGGTLSNRARKKESASLTAEEVRRAEEIYDKVFADGGG